MKHKAIIISAPSGAGKTTIVKHLLSTIPQLEFSISACSRQKRNNETDGSDYYFISAEEFRQKIKQEEFKTEFVAENTIKHFLNDKKYSDRRFTTLKKHLGGFEDNELRKLLVRSGAICIRNEKEEEFWTLLKE